MCLAVYLCICPTLMMECLVDNSLSRIYASRNRVCDIMSYIDALLIRVCDGMSRIYSSLMHVCDITHACA